MKAVLQIIGGAFQDLWADLWTVLAVNFFWLLANLLVIPGPPATLAVTAYGNRLAHGEETDFGDFWKAFRKYWGQAWRWGGIHLAVLVFLVGDIVLTDQFPATIWKPYLQGLYVMLLAVWLAVQFFTLPFLFEQERMSLRLALRNSTALIARNPAFTLSLFVLVILIFIAGTFAFLLSVMFGAVFTACVSNRAVLNRLKDVGLAGSRV